MRYRIILMRHAKSSWSTGESDHGRPLNKRGLKDAPCIARKISDHGWIPDLVISSDSMRTRQTWEGLANILSGDTPIQWMRSFYLGGYAAFEAAVELVPVHVRTLLLLGHNPGWEDVAYRLSGQSIQMTTGNAILMEKEATDWVSALHDSEGWRVDAIFRPREPRITPK